MRASKNLDRQSVVTPSILPPLLRCDSSVESNRRGSDEVISTMGKWQTCIPQRPQLIHLVVWHVKVPSSRPLHSVA
jgi:hypothetical protein